jgi:hypothetical protein
MARKTIIKRRINIEAWKMKEFYANDLLTVLNNYPNMDGRGRTKYQMTIWRLTNLLKGNPNVKYIKMCRFHKKPGMWKWIGDDEE